MVDKFINETLRDHGRSMAMRRKVLTNLKTLIKHAQVKGLVAQNVASAVSVDGQHRGGKQIAIPTIKELQSVLGGAKDPWRPLIVTAIFTGMRASELRGLTWDHVDSEAGIIKVRQRADQWGEIGPTKSKAGVRDIPLAPMVINTLKEWKLACPKGDLKLVFPNGPGQCGKPHQHR